MRAALARTFGGIDALEIAELPDPQPGPGQVVVRVSVAALNFFDTLILKNRYQVTPELPFSPSGECCGTIEAVGEGVEGWRPGERVAVYAGYGACREAIAVDASRLARVPDGVSDEKAAGLTVTYGTGLHALKDRARIRPGETLAVLGAAGGTGLAAVELGRVLGARVIACASSADKLELAREHGADELLDYAKGDLKEGLKALTGGRGVDVIYDPVGGELAEPALRAIAWQGRYLVVGFAGGDIPRVPFNLMLLKGCDVLGVYWGAFLKRDPAGHAANMADVMRWTAEGRLTAHVHGVYPLEDTQEALRVLAAREARGKVLVRM